MVKVQYKTKTQICFLGNKNYVLESIVNLDDAIDDLCAALTCSEQKDPFAEDLCPYFGILWPASIALATYLSEHPELVKNQSVLELGCGLGLPSLVAAHQGANVLATDYHPDVEEYFLRNTRHSSVRCEYKRLNWRDDLTENRTFDIVMGSDVLYESKHAREVALGLIRFLNPKGKILLSDPGRAYLQQFVTAMRTEGFKDELIPVKIEDKEIFVFLFERSH